MGIFKRLLEDIASAREMVNPDIKVVDLVRAVVAWNESREIVNFARIVANVFIFGFSGEDPLILGQVLPSALLTRELNGIFMPRRFFAAPQFAEIVTVFVTVFTQTIDCLLAPVASAHRCLPSHGIVAWAVLQQQGFELFRGVVPSGELPRCKAKNHQDAVGMMYPYWGSMIAVELLIAWYRWGEICQLYSVRDLPIVLYCLHHVTRTATIAYEQARIVKAIFSVKNSSKKTAVWTRTEKEVNALVEKEPRANAELLMTGLCAILRANFHLVKLLRHWGNLIGGEGLFFRDEALFRERSAPISKTSHFEPLVYQDYTRDLTVEERMEEPMLADAKKQFFAGNNELLLWVKATGKKNDPLVRDAIGSGLAGIAILNQLSRDKKFCLKNPEKILFPVFTVCTK
jgi:hypothetical protein